MNQKDTQSIEPNYKYKIMQALREQRMIIGTSTLGDWFALLSTSEITDLGAKIETFATQSEDMQDDILSLLVCLIRIESGNVKLKIDSTQLVDYLDSLMTWCNLEEFCRKGVFNRLGQIRILGERGENSGLTLSLTPKGMLIAQHPNCDPLLKRILTEMGKPLLN